MSAQVEAEQALIGSCLIDAGAFGKIPAQITPDNFSRPDHSKIWSTILELERQGKPHDAVIVAWELANAGEELEAGGVAYLIKIARDTLCANNVAIYAEHVRKGARANGRDRNAPQPFTVQRLDEMLTARREAVIQGLGLDAGAVAAIVGSPNSGKTVFAVSLGIAVAAGSERWLGLKVSGGAVVYFGAEAPASVRMRARAALARMGAAGAPPFYVSDAAPAIGGEVTATPDAGRVIATISEVQSAEGARVRLVFIDTLASCLGDGDENGDGMIRLVAASKAVALQTDACVVLLHHPSKGDRDSGNLRGHGSLAAACDSIIRIEVDEPSGVRTATLVKARDYATGLQVRFELDQVALPDRDSFGDATTTVVIRPTTQAAPRPRPAGARQQELLGELERRYRTGERQWDEASIRKACQDLGMHRNTVKPALSGLIAAGYLAGSSAAYTLKHPPDSPP